MNPQFLLTLLLAVLLLDLAATAIIDLNEAENRGIHTDVTSPSGEAKVDLRSRFAGGDGSAENPYRIANVTQLQDMNLDLGANYTLVNDIDASETREWNDGKGFTPIANDLFPSFSGFEGTPFTISFDGKGYNITGLFINNTSNKHMGLFCYIGNEGRISNVNLIDCSISGEDYVGSLIAYNSGIIQNCHVAVNSNGVGYVGGLIGDNYGLVQNCYTTGKVTGIRNVGGLVGYNHGTVETCYTMGNVDGDDGAIGGLIGTNLRLVKNCYAIGDVSGNLKMSGGLIGLNWDTLENCYATGNVTGNEHVGGLIGYSSGMVKNCFAKGIVTGDSDNIGGLIGYNNNGGILLNCYATGSVSGKRFVGGLLGNNHGAVENCYGMGNVSGNERIGGLVGLNYAIIEDCYAKGNVSGGDTVGGLVGMTFNDGIIKNCYATGYVSENYRSIFVLVGNSWEAMVENSFWESSNGRGKTTIEMMIKSTYTEAGWDFENIWAINEYVDYPHFQWELRPIIEAVDSDNDGFPDIIDDFPNDPVISLDTDGDGSPDEWLLQKNRTNSTTGLHLDAFPLDPAASIDSDRDGMPDEWELQHGFDPTDASDGTGDRDGDGYTNVEEFLNETRP